MALEFYRISRSRRGFFFVTGGIELTLTNRYYGTRQKRKSLKWKHTVGKTKKETWLVMGRAKEKDTSNWLNLCGIKADYKENEEKTVERKKLIQLFAVKKKIKNY